MDVPEPIRELRPHFIFKIIEKVTDCLWEIGGGAVMAAMLWLVSKLRHNLDYVAVTAVFLVGVLMMYLSVRVHGRKTRTMSGQPLPDYKRMDELEVELEQAKAAMSNVKTQVYQEENRRKELAWEWQQGELKRAPRLLIHYSKDQDGRENLSFTNDGETTAQGAAVGPLTWIERRTITLDHQLPPIPSKHTHVCRMNFEQSPSHGTRLFDFMRQHTPVDASTTVTMSFQGEDERSFAQDFTLTTFPDGSLIWNPSRVKLPG